MNKMDKGLERLHDLMDREINKLRNLLNNDNSLPDFEDWTEINLYDHKKWGQELICSGDYEFKFSDLKEKDKAEGMLGGFIYNVGFVCKGLKYEDWSIWDRCKARRK